MPGHWVRHKLKAAATSRKIFFMALIKLLGWKKSSFVDSHTLTPVISLSKWQWFLENSPRPNFAIPTFVCVRASSVCATMMMNIMQYVHTHCNKFSLFFIRSPQTACSVLMTSIETCSKFVVAVEVSLNRFDWWWMTVWMNNNLKFKAAFSAVINPI